MPRKSDKSKGGERKKYYMISAISQMYDIHPNPEALRERGAFETLRTEREHPYLYGRGYQAGDDPQPDPGDGVNLAESILSSDEDRLETLQDEINQFLEYVREEFYKGREEEFTNRQDAIVRSVSTKIIRVKPDGHKPQET